jgi:hypothetical protein
MKWFLSPISCLILLLILASCEKEPGEGGSSSIQGYVHVTDYNSNFLIILDEYDGYDEDVYLVYGDDMSFTERTRTGPDGKFEFKYLREGDYTVYVYSDTLATYKGGKIALEKTVNIPGRKQAVDAGTFEIKK